MIAAQHSSTHVHSGLLLCHSASSGLAQEHVDVWLHTVLNLTVQGGARCKVQSLEVCVVCGVQAS